MGGIGSGEWHRWNTRTTVEDCIALDVRDLARRGLLTAGSAFGWEWSLGGKPNGNIQIQVQPGAVLLNYKTRPYGAQEWTPRQLLVSLDRTACTYGGYRHWFRCPYCSRRVAKLHSNGGLFACRHCHRLPYASQAETPRDRAARRMWKFRRKLETDSGVYWRKPKGMHSRTFRRLIEQERAWSGIVDGYTTHLWTRIVAMTKPKATRKK